MHFCSSMLISSVFIHLIIILLLCFCHFELSLLSLAFSAGSATGTVPSTVLSFSDYISRPEGQNSILRFEKGETEKFCRVVIIDDSLYEPDESFNVSLSVVLGGRLGPEYPSTSVNILPDLDDGRRQLLILYMLNFY